MFCLVAKNTMGDEADTAEAGSARAVGAAGHNPDLDCSWSSLCAHSLTSQPLKSILLASLRHWEWWSVLNTDLSVLNKVPY